MNKIGFILVYYGKYIIDILYLIISIWILLFLQRRNETGHKTLKISIIRNIYFCDILLVYSTRKIYCTEMDLVKKVVWEYGTWKSLGEDKMGRMAWL